jgi:HSP20 family protein
MTTVTKYNPFKPFTLDSFVDDLFGRSLSDVTNSNATSSTPAVNITETDDAFTLAFATPGLSKEDFNISIEDNKLIVSAEKETKSEETVEGKVTKREFNYSSFKRSFILNDQINQDGIKASYENGILHVELQKKEEAKPILKKIEIS